MTLRWISLVPPAIVRQRLARKPNVHWRGRADGGGALGAEQREAQLLRALVVLDAEQLAHARLGARAGARRPTGGWSAGRGAATVCASATSAPSWSSRWVEPQRGRRRRGRPTRPSSASMPPPNDEPAAHGHALVGQRRAGERPAAVDLADHAVVGHEDVVEEDLVEHRQPGHLPERADVDARRAHVDDDVGDAEVLRRARVGAGEADAPVGFVRHRGPHLLPVQQPAAVGAGAGRGERGEVGAGAGLAEQLAPRDVAEQRRPHPALLLLGGAVGRDRRLPPTPRWRGSAGGSSRGAAPRRSRAARSAPASRPHGVGQCGTK